MKKNKNDILTLKAREYAAAAKEAENAVSMVSNAMNKLKEANTRMTIKMKDIEEHCASMMAIHAQMGKDRAHNEAVISNFSKLLCVEE